MRRTKTAEKFRQLAAAPEPIISPDAGVIITAAAAQAAANAKGAVETAEVGADDMTPQGWSRSPKPSRREWGTRPPARQELGVVGLRNGVPGKRISGMLRPP